MRYLLFLSLIFILSTVQAQTDNFEIKVVSQKYQTVKGTLKKVSAEGIGVQDYKGNYVTFRPYEITRLKIRKRGLTVGEGTLAGLAAGGGLGVAIWSLDESGNSDKEMIGLTAILTGTGLAVGTIAGVVSEIANTKYALTVNENPERYKQGCKKLEQYINRAYVEHVN